MQRWLYKILIFIAVVTGISGLALIFAAPYALQLLRAEANKTSNYFFAVVGMFMFLFGGLLYRSLKNINKPTEPLFWCGLQKMGAALAVGLGVYRSVFASLALGVAIFDLLSGILLFLYLRHLKTAAL